MKDKLFFSLFLLLTLLSPILLYRCNYFDITTSFNQATSYLQLFARPSEPASKDHETRDRDLDSNKVPYKPETVFKCCNSQKDKELLVDSKQLVQAQAQSQSRAPAPAPAPRRSNYANKKEEAPIPAPSDDSNSDSSEYHLDKTRNRPIVLEDEYEEVEAEAEAEAEAETEVASTYNKLIADIPSSFPAILDEGGENPRQMAEVSKKRRKRKRGRDNKRRHHRKRGRNQRRPRRRNVKNDAPSDGAETPRRETEVKQQVVDDMSEDVSEDMSEDLTEDVDELNQDDESFDDMEVGEVLWQLGQAIKKTAVVMSNHAVQYPKDVCVVIVFVLLLIKLATWLSGGYRQARRNLVPLTTSVPLLSTSASRGTSFSEGGLKPTLQTSFTCIPQTMESIRHLLPAESQPVIPRGLLKAGYGYQTTSETCNLRGIPDTFTILKNMPADIDVADIYLDTFRRMALQAGKMKTANLLKESQLFLEYRRNSYLKNNLSQNGQNISSSRVIPTDSVLANISTDSQN